MRCESCHQREAMVHLTTTIEAEGLGQEPGTQREQHFCEQCADTYFACTPGMNSARGLICLSDSYRSKLWFIEREVLYLVVAVLAAVFTVTILKGRRTRICIFVAFGSFCRPTEVVPRMALESFREIRVFHSAAKPQRIGVRPSPGAATSGA